MSWVSTYVSEYGHQGSGNDELWSPLFITTDDTYLYIADVSNNRIVKRLASDLSYVSQIGSFGSGVDEFQTPIGICNDGTYLYICDAYNCRIQKRLMSDLSYVDAYGTCGSGDGEFTTAFAVCTNGTYFWVVDQDAFRVQQFACVDGSFVDKVGSSGTGNLQFNYATGIDVDGTNLFVADSGNSRIQVLSAVDLSFIDKFGTYGTGDMEFGSYTLTIIQNDGLLLIGDPENNRVIVRDASDGSFLYKFGTLGSGDLNFNNPGCTCMDNINYTYTCDSQNNRIIKRQLLDAIPPANDDFANRTVISPGGSPYVGESTLGATLEAGEEEIHSSPPGVATVWYELTAPNDGNPHLYEITLTPIVDTSWLAMLVLGCNTCPPTVVTDLYQNPTFIYAAYSDCDISGCPAIKYIVLHPNETVYIVVSTPEAYETIFDLAIAEVSIATLGKQLVAGAQVLTVDGSFSGNMGTPTQVYSDSNSAIQFYKITGIPNQPFTMTITGVDGSGTAGTDFHPYAVLYHPSVATAVRYPGVPNSELTYVSETSDSGYTVKTVTSSGWLLDESGVAFVGVFSWEGDTIGQFNGTLDIDDTGVVTLPAVYVGFNTARLRASVYPGGVPTSVGFDWGVSTAYGVETELQAIGSGTSYVVVEQVIYGITAGTTFYFRTFKVS